MAGEPSGKDVPGTEPVYAVDRLIGEARRLAAEYRRTTGKPLPGVSAEIAMHDAARLLNLELVAGSGGFDAVGRGARSGRRIQIKGRTIFDESKGGQRIGQIKTGEVWDSVVLVLMDEEYEPYEIYEAQREDLLQAVSEKAQTSRGKRGALSVAKFKVIGRLVWDRDCGLQAEVWENRPEGGSI